MIDHLRKNNIGYFPHMLRAIRIAALASMAVPVLVIHSIFPFIFEDTGTKLLRKALEKKEEGR